MPSWHSVQLNNDLVVAYPDIYQVALGSDAEFVVLASDGLWDYMGRSIAWSLESVLAPFFFFFFGFSENYLHTLLTIAAQKQFL